jgi:DNA-binding NtrC family response regulator
MTKGPISLKRVGLDSDSVSQREPADATLRIQNLSLTLTVVSDGGRESVLALSGTAETGSPSSAAGPQQEGTDVLRVRAGAPMREVEEAYIRLVLSRTGNKKKRAAKILGISPHTVSNKLRNFREPRAKTTSAPMKRHNE